VDLLDYISENWCVNVGNETELAYSGIKWQASVNTAMNLWVSLKQTTY